MRFRHPGMRSGTVSTDAGSWPIEHGIVDCPEAVGRAAGWAFAPAPPAESKAPPTPPKNIPIKKGVG